MKYNKKKFRSMDFIGNYVNRNRKLMMYNGKTSHRKIKMFKAYNEWEGQEQKNELCAVIKSKLDV